MSTLIALLGTYSWKLWLPENLALWGKRRHSETDFGAHGSISSNVKSVIDL